MIGAPLFKNIKFKNIKLKSFGQYLALVVLLCSSALLHAQVGDAGTAESTVDRTDPYKMVFEVSGDTFDRIKAEKENIANDPEVLRTIMEEELLPYINYRFSAYKVLGKYASKVEKKELLEFITVFRTYLISTYAVAMGYYDDQEVEFEPARDFTDRNDVTVRVSIMDEGRPDIKVAFKVRKDRRSGEWLAYDMIAEGISLLSSKQSEFEPILRKQGIQEVISRMRKSISEPIVID